MVPPYILPSPSPIRTYFIKRTSDKKPPILRPNPSYTGFYSEGETVSLGSFLLFLFPLPLSLVQAFVYPAPAERRPSSRDCNSQAWCNGGENAIVPCSCFARGTKTLLPYIHFYSSAILQSQAQHGHVKIDLPPKVSEETQMAVSYATARHVCIYSNVPTQRKIYTRRVFMPLSNVHTNHPRSSRAGSPPICIMASHLTLALPLCLC